MLLHGALTTLEDMTLALLPTLRQTFRATAFDRPGHGRSSRTGPPGTPWRQAEAIHGAVEALGLERPVIIGHSFGGAALAYAIQFPQDTRGVVALAPLAFPEFRLEHIVFGPRATPGFGALLNRSARAFIDPALLPVLWRAMFLPQAVPERFARAFPFAEAGRLAQTYAEGEDAAYLVPGLMRSAIRYSACQAPVRIFTGDQDLVVNPALHARTLSRLLPNASFNELKGLGHMVHHFAQEAIAEAARRFAA